MAVTGEGGTDGGYTRWTTFEDTPKGWGSADYKNLCPKHMAERLKIVEDFYEKGTIENG